MRDAQSCCAVHGLGVKTQNPLEVGWGHLCFRTCSLLKQVLYFSRNISLIYLVILTEQGMVVNDRNILRYNRNIFLKKKWNGHVLISGDGNCSKALGGFLWFCCFSALLQTRLYSYVINVIIGSVLWQHLVFVLELILIVKETWLVWHEDHICIL